LSSVPSSPGYGLRARESGPHGLPRELRVPLHRQAHERDTRCCARVSTTLPGNGPTPLIHPGPPTSSRKLSGVSPGSKEAETLPQGEGGLVGGEGVAELPDRPFAPVDDLDADLGLLDQLAPSLTRLETLLRLATPLRLRRKPERASPPRDS